MAIATSWCDGNLFCILFFSEIPEVAAALVTHAAVKQIVERDISIYKQDETEDYLACK